MSRSSVRVRLSALPPDGCLPFLAPLLAWVVLTGATPGLRTVVIDPGHGGSNEGAPSPYTGHREKYYTLRIGKKVAAHLRAAGVPKVVLTREDDRYVSLADRVRLANELGADVFVSVHLNSTEIPGPAGHETFFLSVDATDEAARRLAEFENDEGAGAPAPADPLTAILRDLGQTRAHHDAQKLAASIQRRMTPRSPFPNLGVKQAPFVVLMGARMPAVVCEVGFLNHPEEGRYITSERGQAEIARGIAEGILDFGRLVLAPRERRTPR